MILIILPDELQTSHPKAFSIASILLAPITDFALVFLHMGPIDLSQDFLPILLVDTVKTRMFSLERWVQPIAGSVRI